jgi:hypothetical protein
MTSATLAAVLRIRISLGKECYAAAIIIDVSNYSTILYCSQNFFEVMFVGMDLKSFRIISLQGPKLFRRQEAEALQNVCMRFFLYIYI